MLNFLASSIDLDDFLMGELILGVSTATHEVRENIKVRIVITEKIGFIQLTPGRDSVIERHRELISEFNI